MDRKRVDWVPDSVRWTASIDEVLASDAEILVEVVGGLDPAGDWQRKAIAAGKSVVTANKQLMAHEGGELLRLAAQRGVHLGFEAAVAGGIPVTCTRPTCRPSAISSSRRRSSR